MSCCCYLDVKIKQSELVMYIFVPSMHVLGVCKPVLVCKCMWDTCVSAGVSQYVVCVIELHFVFEYNTCFVKR